MRTAKVKVKWGATASNITQRELVVDKGNGAEVSFVPLELTACEYIVELPANGSASVRTVLTNSDGRKQSSEPYVISVGTLDEIKPDFGFSHEIVEVIDTEIAAV